jgi:hypothetical protein
MWDTKEVKQAEADITKLVRRGSQEMLRAALHREGEDEFARISRMADVFKITAHWIDKVDARIGETNTVYEQEDWLE